MLLHDSEGPLIDGQAGIQPHTPACRQGLYEPTGLLDQLGDVIARAALPVVRTPRSRCGHRSSRCAAPRQECKPSSAQPRTGGGLNFVNFHEEGASFIYYRKNFTDIFMEACKLLTSCSLS
jgi:hypothetical protein